MAKPRPSLLLFFCFLLFTCACLAHHESQFNDCQLDSLKALEPDNRIESEAGVTETWNSNNHPELRCAGVSLLRRTINVNGLHLPSYVAHPELHFIEQGRGVLGIAVPGCAETYEEPQPQGERRGRPHQLPQDRHQKVRYVKQGDVIAIPPGVPYWSYNYGNTPLIIITLLHTTSMESQLDPIPRRFYLAGNPEEEHPETVKGGKEEEEGGNVFGGFDPAFLAEILKVKQGLIKKLQSPDENLDQIIEGGRRREREDSNALEETVCTLKLHENIADPARADLFNPRAGRISTVNSLTLPVLKWLQLSAEWVNLYKNGIYIPHWTMNANSLMYVTRGRGRVQVVNCQGKSVFNGEVRKGEMLVVPQNFVVAKQAGSEGLEYIVFKTKDKAKISTLVGLNSAISATPAEVLGRAFGLSPQEVSALKYNRNEGVLASASPSSHSHSQEEDGHIAMVGM
ncbi:RmlC-like cupin domain superfamily [Sesbania bispinosa]|nr:RmlC-like cupin domain superfamily [Sesbania bispinosa]